MNLTFYPEKISGITKQFSGRLHQLAVLSDEIASELHKITGKKAKGDQLVAVLGEAAVAALTGGRVLPGETTETDVLVGKTRISVKTRRGTGKAWTQTSAIPTNAPGAVDYLAFVNLDNSYRVKKIWLFPWYQLIKNGRIKPKKVHGNPRGFYFVLSPQRDASFQVYPN